MAAQGIQVARALAPRPAPTQSTNSTAFILRAKGTKAANVGPVFDVRVNGNVVATVEISSGEFADYILNIPAIAAGSKVELVFTNDATISGQDRNAFVEFISQGNVFVMPSAPIVQFDRGYGAAAFDGVDVVAGTTEIYSAGAMRLSWPQDPATLANLARQQESARFARQATFGVNQALLDNLTRTSFATWIDAQMAMPMSSSYVDAFQSKMSRGPEYLPPKGASYTPLWNVQQFWKQAATGPDQLRRRTAFALQQIFTVSHVNSDLWGHGRPYAAFLDSLNRNAFGNFRTLIQDVALSPVMGIYLSHIGNMPEDPATGRMPDENFARELMQLFTIGLIELNIDGTPKLNGSGNQIETYTNADVMALAKVFTGYTWAFPEENLNADNFRFRQPDYRTTGTARIDLKPMKNYAAYFSVSEKKLFQGKPWEVTISEKASASQALKIALDTLFNHPNVGPYISRQLIQRMVTANPSPAYVARVAQVFNDNGSGVRGDLGAVVKAILLDSEARAVTPPVGFGKLVEPVVRATSYMRAFRATSKSGEWLLNDETTDLLQRPMYAPSVFGYYRPGYVPPNSAFAPSSQTQPEFQISTESTMAAWVNRAEKFVGTGLGYDGTGPDVVTSLSDEIALAARGTSDLVDRLNTVLLGGRMSSKLRSSILRNMATLQGAPESRNAERARLAIFLVLSSPEYLTQR